MTQPSPATDQLIAAARQAIEAGTLELVQTPFSLETILDPVRSMIADQAQTKGHTEERNCITFHDVSLIRVE